MLNLDLLDNFLTDFPTNILRKIRGLNAVSEPTRPYLQPVAWIAEPDGQQRYAVAAVFPLPDSQLAYVEWDGKNRRYAYEAAHYIVNPDPDLTKKGPTGGSITLLTTEFDVESRITLGEMLPSATACELRLAAGGKPSPDCASRAQPA